MIDIHTHILPNVDDGSNSVELSLSMLEEEIKQGVTDVYLTPHVCYGNKQYYEKEELFEKFDKFKEVCKKWRAGEITATAAMKAVNLKPNTFYRRVKCIRLSPND